MFTNRDLTVVVTCKNRDRNIQYCVSSIYNCTPRPNGMYLVDYGSDTNLKELFKEYYPWLVVIRLTKNTKVFHKPRAINVGLRCVKTAYTCCTDADQIVEKNFFAPIIATINKVPNSFVFCQTFRLKHLPEWFTHEDTHTRYGEVKTLAFEQYGKQMGDGCCHTYQTSWVKYIGGYEETFAGWGAQDSDLRRRAAQSKLKLLDVTPYTSMIHLPHEKIGDYYSKETIDKNMTLYKNRRRDRKQFANENIVWGKR